MLRSRLCSVAVSTILLIAACRVHAPQTAFAGRWEADTNLGHGDHLTVALRLDALAPGEVQGLIALFGHGGGVTWVRGFYGDDSIHLTMLQPCQADSAGTPIAIGFTGVLMPDSEMLRGEVWDKRPQAPFVYPITLRRGLSSGMADQFQGFERECPGGLPRSSLQPQPNMRLKPGGAAFQRKRYVA